MKFSEFVQSIVSPDLKAVAAHWNAVRRDKLMPSWDDLQPAAMAKQLPRFALMSMTVSKMNLLVGSEVKRLRASL